MASVLGKMKEHGTVISATAAAVSVIVAVVFSAFQVKESAEAQRQAKTATELGLLTQLQSMMRESLYKQVLYRRQFRRLRRQGPSALGNPAYRVLGEEASNTDYFAWLFDRGHLTTAGADQLWGPRMICEFKRVFAPSFKDPVRELPNLYQFVLEHPGLDQRCD